VANCAQLQALGDPRAITIPAGDVMVPNGLRPGDFVEDIGRYWYAGNACPEGPGRNCARLYLNRATGERREETTRSVRRDIDTPDLAPLPLSRLLHAPHIGVSRGKVVLIRQGRGMAIGKCPAPTGCFLNQFQDDVAVWSFRDRVEAYNVRTNRHYVWRLRRPAGYQLIAIATRYEVVLSVLAPNSNGRWRIYFAPMS
jgi:hypothetical protein